MKEKPILFSGSMIRAILEGRKTQTRRIAKVSEIRNRLVLNRSIPFPDDPKVKAWFPYGGPGGRLWVRERHQLRDVSPDGYPQCLIRYADGITLISDPDDSIPRALCDDEAGLEINHSRWRPSIHMPRWASRITLEITSERVERLQDISAKDCWAEGIGRHGRPLEALMNILIDNPKINIGELALRMPGHFGFGDDPAVPSDREKVTMVTPQGVYAALWESINGPGSWDTNPWVHVIGFRRVEGGAA